MTNKEAYHKLCETEGVAIPLFQQSWWLEAVSDGKPWDVSLVYADDGRIAAAWPFQTASKYGLRYSLQPRLTQFCGPWYNYACRKHPDRQLNEYDRLQYEADVAESLIRDLDTRSFLCFRQCFSPTITNWQPFYEHGFVQTTRYTYRIEDLSDIGMVYDGFIAGRKRQIAKDDSRFSCAESDDVEWFADYHEACCSQRGRREYIPRRFMVRLCAQALSRKAGNIFRLRDADNRDAAAAFVAHDATCAYMLMTVFTPSMGAAHPMPVLVWRMLQHFAPLSVAFDFEGSMIPGAAYFFRSFGAVQVPFFQLSRYSSPLIRMAVEHKAARDRCREHVR